MKDRLHDEAVAELLRDDPGLAVEILNDGATMDVSDPAGMSHCVTSARASHLDVARAVQRGVRRHVFDRPAR